MAKKRLSRGLSSLQIKSKRTNYLSVTLNIIKCTLHLMQFIYHSFRFVYSWLFFWADIWPMDDVGLILKHFCILYLVRIRTKRLL